MGWVRTEVDGVPTFWTESDGDLRAGLTFRVGMADERLAVRGITHLVEHLALHGLSQSDYHANGEVGTVTTTFVTRGSAETVCTFLTSVCQALSYLPTERMAVENQILRTEEAGRGRGPLGPLALWRYGASSYGLPGYEELGVGQHSEEDLRAWAWRWFTRGNAVLWLVGGPVPDGLRLTLPDGERKSPPAPTSALRRTPAFFQERVDGVAMSALLDRSATAVGYAHLLESRLRQALRFDNGLSYSPSTAYELRDCRTAQVAAFADGLPEAYGGLVSGFVAELDRLAGEPVAAAESDKIVGTLRDGAQDRDSEAGATVAAARDELLGRAPMSREELITEIESITPEDLQAVARQARDSALLMVPPGHRPPGQRFTPAPTQSTSTVEGRALVALRPEGAPVPTGGEHQLRLVVGPEGISRVEATTFITIRFAQCEVVLAWPDGARFLIGTDGFSLRIEPTLWENGHLVPEAIDRGVDPGLVLRQPARAADAIPKPAAHQGRHRRGWLRRGRK